MIEKKQKVYKIGIFGEFQCGKTSLVRAFIGENNINIGNRESDSPNIYKKQYKLDHHIIDLLIWDIPGDSNYGIKNQYLKELDGIVLAYDITNPHSYENMHSELLKNNSYHDIQSIIVGCKKDKEKERGVDNDKAYRTSINFNKFFFETSAITGEGIEDSFECLVNLIENKKKEKKSNLFVLRKMLTK